jgi:NADH-quinone oxidoreductase subunit A
MAEFLGVLIFLIASFLFVGVTLLLSGLVRPSKISSQKASSYECGEIPVGSSWVQFNIRFYVFALAFLIFDVEAVFLFPWAVVFNDLGLFAFVEGLIFIAILVLGLAYLWAKGDLEWIREEDRPAHRSGGTSPTSKAA